MIPWLPPKFLPGHSARNITDFQDILVKQKPILE